MKEFIQQLLQNIIFPRINKKKGSIGIVGATAYRASPQQRDDKLREEPAVLYHDAGLFSLIIKQYLYQDVLRLRRIC